jgi:hypothetical protein
VTGVERQPDQAMGRDDRGEVDLERRDRETLGRGGQVHADETGIGGKGRQPEAGAPGVVLAPGRAVGTQRARPTRLGGVDGGLGRKLADLVGAARVERALWKDEISEDTGRHNQPCPVAAVKTASSAMSSPPLRRRLPCFTGRRTDVPPGYPSNLPLQVAIPEVLPVCNVRKQRLLDLSPPGRAPVPGNSADSHGGTAAVARGGDPESRGTPESWG